MTHWTDFGLGQMPSLPARRPTYQDRCRCLARRRASKGSTVPGRHQGSQPSRSPHQGGTWHPDGAMTPPIRVPFFP